MSILRISDFSLNLKRDTEWNSILHHISFQLNKGETIGIVGESGSGKSVTALSIMRLIEAKKSQITSGNIIFTDNDKEIDLTQLKEKELQKIRGNRIAMIFQEPMTSLNPVIRCGEQITEAILLHTKLSKKEAKNRVLELFREVMLDRKSTRLNSSH